MERHSYWYSIIQYRPSALRGEVINVGMVLHSPEDGTLTYRLLDENNDKIKYFLSDSNLSKVYRTHREFVDYLFQHVNDNSLNFVGNVQVPSTKSEQYLIDVRTTLPQTLQLSDPQFLLSDNKDLLFDKIIKKYIGEQFFESESKPFTTKAHARRIFEEHQWLGTKVKPNVKFSPVRDVPNLRYQIDFVFKNGIWNLLQAVPMGDDRMNDWFGRTHTMIRSFDKDAGFYLLSSSAQSSDQTISQMIRFLRKVDPRVSEIKLNSKEFEHLTDRIGTEAKDLSTLETELQGDQLIFAS